MKSRREGVGTRSCTAMIRWGAAIALALLVPAMVDLTMPVSMAAQAAPHQGEETFTRDIAPILQRSCQKCHHIGGVAPIQLVDYDTVKE